MQSDILIQAIKKAQEDFIAIAHTASNDIVKRYALESMQRVSKALHNYTEETPC